MVPVCGLMLHATVVLLFAALLTVAVNCCVCPGPSVAVVGLTVTETVAFAVRVIFAVPNVLESSTEVAVTVPVAALAAVIVAGARYTPVAASIDPVCGLMLQT